MWSPSAAIAAADDNIPGVPLPGVSPFTDTLDAVNDFDDVYYVDLTAGQRFVVALYGDASTDFNLYLYSPGTTTVDQMDKIVDWSESEDYPELILYHVTAPESGRYYLDVYAYAGVGGYQIQYWIENPQPDDEVPGVAIPGSPVLDTLDWVWDPIDTYRVDLADGQTIHVSLNGAAGTLFVPILFAPGTANVWTTDGLAAPTQFDAYPESLAYTVPVGAGGQYYLCVQAWEGDGAYSLSYSITAPSPIMPVYRFYNLKNGSHFYTASEVERDIVIDRWPDVYEYEGAAYSINTANPNNNAPLWRFYNNINGTHFYTASVQERDAVRAKWPDIFTDEGPGYNVCATGVPGALPMYRFYNRQIGSHFYTISAQERDTVIRQWMNVYNYEGTAYWIAQ